MKIVGFEANKSMRLGVVEGDTVVDLQAVDAALPSDLGEVLRRGNGDLKPLANLAKKAPGSKVWLVSLGPKAKLQQVMMTVAQKVPFELVALDGLAGGFTEAAEVAAALAEAIAYVWIEDDTYDKKFVEGRTLGFETFKQHLLGKDDGVKKTPRWAAEITGVSAAIIQALASFERLDLRGGVVKVGGRVEAFTMGGRLTPDTAVIPIEIANPAELEAGDNKSFSADTMMSSSSTSKRLSAVLDFLRHKQIPQNRHTAWMYTGSVILLFFGIQVMTGVLLAFYYRPTLDAANKSVGEIMTKVPLGWVIRSVHSWSATFMIAAVFIHLLSLWMVKSYRPPRELTWMTGCGLLGLVLLIICGNVTGMVLASPPSLVMSLVCVFCSTMPAPRNWIVPMRSLPPRVTIQST